MFRKDNQEENVKENTVEQKGNIGTREIIRTYVQLIRNKKTAVTTSSAVASNYVRDEALPKYRDSLINLQLSSFFFIYSIMDNFRLI